MGQQIICMILILNILLKISPAFHLSEFVIDYFVGKEIRVVNVLVCNRSDGINMHKYFQERRAPFLTLVHSSEFEKNDYFAKHLVNSRDLNCLGIFIDFSCESLNLLIEEVLNTLANNFCYNVLLWNKMSIFKEFKEDSILFGTQLILASPKNKSKVLHDITATKKIGPIGYWENGYLLIENLQTNKYNFQNQTLHGLVSFTDQNIKNNSIIKLKNEDIIDLKLSSLANFSLIIYKYLREIYGLQWELTTVSNPNELMNTFLNDSDDSFDFIITSENHLGRIRNEIISLPSIKTIRQCLVFKHPPVYSYKTFYLKPFSIGLWICLGIFLIISAVLSYLMCLVKIEDFDHNELSISGNMLYCLGALTNQGLSVASKRSSKRLIQFNILQLSLFISNFYSAVILNYLLYPTHSTIKGVDDIIQQGFDIGYEDSFYNTNTLSINTSEIFQYGIENMIASYNVTTGVEKIRKSKFAFLSIDSNIYKKTSEYLTDTEICELASIPLKNTFELSMYLKKSSPYKEYFQKGILLLKETGIINYEDKTWNKRNQKCLDMVKYAEIGLDETLIALKIFVYGYICSTIIFMLELINAKICSSQYHKERRTNKPVNNVST